MLDVGRHPDIELLAYSEIESLEGEAGNFSARIRRKARFVEEDKCTGCGACSEKCPTKVPDPFNLGLGTRKAIYTHFAQGIPSTHTIDPEHCRFLQGKKCGVCQKTCQADAINFDQKDKVEELNVGAVIIASGYDVFDPSQIPEYRYGQIANVVTSMEFERLLSAGGPTGGHLHRPSDMAVLSRMEKLEKKAKKSPKPAEELEKLKKKAENLTSAKRLAFVQCVGSRDLRFYPHCSGYCCMHSIKEAIIAYEHEPGTSSIIFGMDIRAVGKGFEEYRIRGRDNAKIDFCRSRIAEITEGPDKNPLLTYEDTRKMRVETGEFDLVILATACAPSSGVKKLAKILGVEIDESGFFKTDEIQPLDTTKPGIFVCGCAHGPMDIPESVAQASSAAARAVRIMTGETLRKAS